MISRRTWPPNSDASAAKKSDSRLVPVTFLKVEMMIKISNQESFLDLTGMQHLYNQHNLQHSAKYFEQTHQPLNIG